MTSPFQQQIDSNKEQGITWDLLYYFMSDIKGLVVYGVSTYDMEEFLKEYEVDHTRKQWQDGSIPFMKRKSA